MSIIRLMDENQNIPLSNSESHETADAASPAKDQERVYDFTPDLNIAPIKNPDQEVPAATETTTPIKKPSTPLQNAVETFDILKNRREPKNTPILPEKIGVPQYGNSIDARGPLVGAEKTPVNPMVIKAQNIVAEPATNENASGNEKALRTYESDIAEFMARKKISTAGIVIAENQKKELEKIANISQKTPEPKPEMPLQQAPKEVLPETKKAEIAIERELPKQERVGEMRQAMPLATETINKTIDGTLIANQENNELPRNHSGKKLFYLLLSMIFILGGIIVAYYLYSISPLA